MTLLNEHLRAIEAGDEVCEAMSKYPSASACWEALVSPTGERRPDWAVWWVCRVRGWGAVEEVVRRAVLRSARVFAADACEKAGLTEHAEKLREITDGESFETIRKMSMDAARATGYFADSGTSRLAAYIAAGHAAEATYIAGCVDAGSSAASVEVADSSADAMESAAAAPSRDREIDAQLADIRELLTCPWTETP